MPRNFFVAIFSIAVLALAGCATQGQYAANVYSSGLQEQQVQLGKVMAVRPVVGRGGSGIGSVLGAVAGGVIGSSIGHGLGSTVAGVIGAGAGAIAGGQAQSQMMAQRVNDVTVRLRDGQLIAVVEHGRFVVGETVQVIHDQGTGYDTQTTRILPY